MAIVDASTINAALWARLFPELNGMARTMWVDTTAALPIDEGPGPAGSTIAGLYRGTKAKYMTGLTFQASQTPPAKRVA